MSYDRKNKKFFPPFLSPAGMRKKHAYQPVAFLIPTGAADGLVQLRALYGGF